MEKDAVDVTDKILSHQQRKVCVVLDPSVLSDFQLRVVVVVFAKKKSCSFFRFVVAIQKTYEVLFHSFALGDVLVGGLPGFCYHHDWCLAACQFEKSSR
jgi:hypothetical protein